MKWSALQFEPYVTAHSDAIKAYAGSRYNVNKTGRPRSPMNLLKLAVSIWTRQLVTQSPRCIINTKFPTYKTNAYELELATNHLLKATNFGATLEEVVQNAIFGLGVMKVGITSKYMLDAFGYSAAAGQPYASPVLMEDWLHDMNARTPEEFDWCGNRYKVPLHVVLNNPDYDQQAKDLLERLDGTSSASPRELETGNSGTDYASMLSRDESDLEGRTQYYPHVELWDIWLPIDRLLVTMPAEEGSKPLQVREWEGPEHGPYHLLQFGKVPGNLMPAAPAQDLYDMQELVTKLFNQLGRQALRQKTITLVDGQAESDGTAEGIRDSMDGETVRAGSTDSAKEMRYGGADPDNMAFLQVLKELFSYLAGNLDSMGGLGQQAETLGQERMLAESSSEMLRDMQSRVIDFSEKGISDLSWYMYTDPTIEIPLTKPIEGYGDIPFTYGPSNRKADFFMYAFEVNPYSLKSKSPSERLEFMTSIAQNFMVPLAPNMAEMGLSFNLKRLFELFGKYSDMPEITEIVTSMTPFESEAMPPPGHGPRSGTGGGDRPLQSPVTERKYTRTNVSGGGTPKSQNLQLMQSLLAGSSGKE
jgi:hypothetical protein